MSYRDAMEYTRGLQRFVAEIHVFLISGNGLLGRSLMESEPIRLSVYGVSVFYLTGSYALDLPDTRRVRITEPHSLCELCTWGITRT